MGKLSAVDVEIFYTSIIGTDPQSVFALCRRGNVLLRHWLSGYADPPDCAGRG